MSTDTDMRRHRPLRSNAVLNPDAEVQEVTRNGRTYLVFPVIAAREMVLDYPENGTREYLPADRIEESVEWWAGTPLTFVHPDNVRKTADHPTAYVENVIGEGHDPEFVDGEKLRVMAWIDVDKAEDIGGLAQEVVERLRAGEELSVSAGYATLDDVQQGGTFDGEEYDIEQGILIPDHIAIFPSDQFRARCSPEDGCAAPRANAIVDEDAPTASDQVKMRANAPASTQVAPTPTDADEPCSPGPCSCGEHRGSTADSGDDNEERENAMEDDIEDEQAAWLGRRVLNALSLDTDATSASPEEPEVDDSTEESETEEAGGDDPSDSTEEDGESSVETEDSTEEPTPDVDESEGNETPDDEDASETEGEEQESESTDSDDSDSSDDSTTAMPETLSIEELAAKSAFGVSTLQEWDEEQLNALEATILENNPELRDKAEEEGDSGGEEDSSAAEDEGAEESNAQNEEDVTTNNTGEGGESEIAQLRQELEETKAMVEDVANQRQNAEKERKVRTVVNAIDGMTEEAAQKLDDEELDSLAETHANKANYQTVPGSHSRDIERPRENAAEDVDEYPAGGRSSYEARKSGGD